jgi:hypothetical protein
MKSATCQICGVLVYTPQSVPVISTDEASRLIADLQEFDLFAARMSFHISERHPEHAREMAAVGFLASKVYATTWCESITEDFAPLRRAWRTVFLQEMTKERTQAAAPAGSDAGNSSDPPASSYEKKSERKASI